MIGKTMLRTIGLQAFVFTLVALIDPIATAQPPATRTIVSPPAAHVAEQLAEAQTNLARQSMIAENARSEVEKLRAELKTKDELLALGIARNAQLAAIADEIADKGLSQRSLEPFVQSQRIEMENLRQSYEDQLRAARIYPETLPPSVEQKMKEELASGKSAS